MTPMAGLIFGGGGGNAAWPKTWVAANANASDNVVFILIMTSSLR
jgi:hypothetical protein